MAKRDLLVHFAGNFKLNQFAESGTLVRTVAERWLERIAQAGSDSSQSVALSGGRITRQLFEETARLAKGARISFARSISSGRMNGVRPPAIPKAILPWRNKRFSDPWEFAREKFIACGVNRSLLRPQRTPSRNKEAVPLDPRAFLYWIWFFSAWARYGHVASLFGASREVEETNVPFLFITNSPKPPPRRITFSYCGARGGKRSLGGRRWGWQTTGVSRFDCPKRNDSSGKSFAAPQHSDFSLTSRCDRFDACAASDRVTVRPSLFIRQAPHLLDLTPMTVLAFETSCDETSVAIVQDGCALANLVSSPIALHAEYGGVVPELATREHLRNLLPMARAALKEAQIPSDAVNAVAATAVRGSQVR